MKKLFLSLLIITVLSTMLFACGGKGNTAPSSSSVTSPSSSSQQSTPVSLPQSTEDEKPVHKHTYEPGYWQSTNEGHYRVYTCHPEVIDMADHMDYVDRDGRCDVCMFVMEDVKTCTVTVVDENNSPVPNVKLKLYTMGEEKFVFTNEEGTATCEFIYTDGLKAMLVSLPDGYNSKKDIFSFDGTNLTITVNK